MTRYHAFIVFVFGFVLIAIHRIADFFLEGWAPAPLIELIPYLLILIFWPKLKEMVLGFLLMLFGFIELNHTRVLHIPEYLTEGLGRTPFTSALFDIGSILFIVASLMLFQVWHNNKGVSEK